MTNPPPTSTALPPILYGTAWKKDETARLVHEALRAGFRGIDTACQPKHYNEVGVGEGIASFLRTSDLARADLYVQTKFTSVDGQDPKRVPYNRDLALREQVSESCAVSRKNLGVDVLDCLVLHSPMRTLEQTLLVWSAFESLVTSGFVRTLGLSNCYSLPMLRAVWEHAKIKPTVLQNRFYKDESYDVSVRQFCKQVRITYQGFWTLTANPHILKMPPLVQIAQRLHWTPAQTFLRCLTQIGMVPLVGTTSPLHMSQDLAIFESELSPSEVQTILALLR
jgi:diketogulonate reductase-like aldo/keto reductase